MLITFLLHLISTPSSVVIEHIRSSEKSREFLLELLTYTNTPTYDLSSYNCVGSTVIMLFNTPSQCSTPKFHPSAVTQYTITYTFVMNDLTLSEHVVEFFSMQQNLT